MSKKQTMVFTLMYAVAIDEVLQGDGPNVLDRMRETGVAELLRIAVCDKPLDKVTANDAPAWIPQSPCRPPKRERKR